MNNSDAAVPDPENPPFDVSKARKWRTGDPTASQEARLYRALRAVVAARQSGQDTALNEAIDAAESVLADYAKG